jgi:MFS family permease
MAPAGIDDEAGYPSPARGNYAVGVLMLAWIVAFLDRQILSLLVNDVRAELGLSDTAISLLQGLAFSLFFSIMALFMGRLVDRYNRRNILICGIVVWSVSTFCCGLAGDFVTFFLARMGTGAGEACLAPAAASMVADYFAPHRRGRALGVMLAGAALGIGMANLLGGLILKMLEAHGKVVALPGFEELANWRVMFMLAAIPAVPLLLLLAALREPTRHGARLATPDAASGFSRYILKHWMLMAGLFTIFGMNAVTGYGIIIWGPAVFMRSFGMSAADTGLMLGAGQLCINSVAAYGGGVVSDVLLRRRPADGRLWTLFVVLPLVLVLLALSALGGSMPVVLIAMIGASGLIASLNSVNYNVLYDVVPSEYRGQIISAYLLFGTFLGLAVGPTAIALITDRLFAAPAMVQFSLTIVCVIATVTALALTAAMLPRYRAMQMMLAAGDA